jgi:type IV pilus assembly protein PilC
MKETTLTQIDLADLCQSLALLLHAGVSPPDGMALLAEEETDPRRKRLYGSLSRRMDEGLSLSAAMEAEGGFPTYAVGLLSTGEFTGKLEEALGALSRYYAGRAALDQRLRSALTYPSVLLLIMLVVIVVLLSQVLPVFDDVYASLGGRLTGVAGGLLLLGRGLDEIMPLLCVVLAVGVIFLAAFSGSVSFRERVLGLWRNKRGDKGVSRKLHDAHTAQALAMGLTSGLTPEESLHLAAQLLADTPAALERCQKAKEKLGEKADLAEALGEAQVLPASSCRLLALGLRGGTGDRVMENIALRLEEEANLDLEAEVGRIEPALVLVTSILVGAILLSVMLPLMHIMAAIG